MIDSHCHLAAKEFATDVDAVIQRALAAGIDRMVCIGDTMQESKDSLKLAEKYEQVFCSVGVHPHHAKSLGSARDDNFIQELKTLAQSSKRVKAIGEIGLDYHYDFSPRDIQQKVFELQLNLAKELNLPAVVHCREAVEDVWSIVNHVQPQKMVIHCCTEAWKDVERFVKAGYFLSFTGIATYPKSDVIRETIKQCPLDQLMIETDAPFLSPVPHRGKRNEPAYVVEVAKIVAEVKGMSLNEIDEVTTKNAEGFFGLNS